MMEKSSVYIVGTGLYIIILIISIVLFRKTNVNHFKFLLYSGLTLIIVNVGYLISIRIIFNNSYVGLLLVYGIFILNLLSVPTILILFIIKFGKNRI